jgi:hypothetical protein
VVRLFSNIRDTSLFLGSDRVVVGWHSRPAEGLSWPLVKGCSQFLTGLPSVSILALAAPKADCAEGFLEEVLAL